MRPLTIDPSLPHTLPDLLSNSLVLRQTAPYLPVASIFALAATSKSLHHLVHHSPEFFRYLNLSTVKSAIVPYEPLDSGAISWRAERMDESLTEDEFYSGPLRGIFSKLQRQHVLCNVQTLVLDGLSVPADLVRDIIAQDTFNVRILSIRETKHLNERKLQQVLRYAVRPGRPAGTPKIKGIYFFGQREVIPETQKQLAASKNSKSPSSKGVMASQGAQIGAAWNHKSSEALNASLTPCSDKWYQCTGRMMPKRPSLEWAETLKACEGIIAFDAVLCRGPRHDPAKAFMSSNYDASSGLPHPGSYLSPAIATVALGSKGCETCYSCPEGPAVFGQSPGSELPLLGPIPLHSSSLRAAQIPHTVDGSNPPPLFVRCEDCLKGRWCERCHKWWDEHCYTVSTVAQRTELQQTEFIETAGTDGSAHVLPKQSIKAATACGDDFKCKPSTCWSWSFLEVDSVGFRTPAPTNFEYRISPRETRPSTSRYVLDIFPRNMLTTGVQIIGVRRDCFGCGHTCITCKELFIRSCTICRSEYCIEDNDASSATKCDWCNYTSRRTVEMY